MAIRPGRGRATSSSAIATASISASTIRRSSSARRSSSTTTARRTTGLATTLKLGGWGHFGQFNDQRFANDGALLADPAGSGVPLKHRGNSGLYAVIDQQLYRPKGGDAQSGISVFSRMSISPSDRNLVTPISTAASCSRA